MSMTIHFRDRRTGEVHVRQVTDTWGEGSQFYWAEDDGRCDGNRSRDCYPGDPDKWVENGAENVIVIEKIVVAEHVVFRDVGEAEGQSITTPQDRAEARLLSASRQAQCMYVALIDTTYTLADAVRRTRHERNELAATGLHAELLPPLNAVIALGASIEAAIAAMEFPEADIEKLEEDLERLDVLVADALRTP